MKDDYQIYIRKKVSVGLADNKHRRQKKTTSEGWRGSGFKEVYKISSNLF